MNKKKRKMVASPGPGYEGRFELAKTRVDNPYDDPKNPKVEVAINKRHDLLIHWYARKTIDDAQYQAGFRLQAIWHNAGIGTPGAIQYDRDTVDVSGQTDPIPDRIIAATDELRAIAAHLGKADYRWLVSLICEGKEISDFSNQEKERKYISKRARDALGYLADYWGATGKASQPIRSEYGSHAA